MFVLSSVAAERLKFEKKIGANLPYTVIITVQFYMEMYLKVEH